MPESERREIRQRAERWRVLRVLRVFRPRWWLRPESSRGWRIGPQIQKRARVRLGWSWLQRPLDALKETGLKGLIFGMQAGVMARAMRRGRWIGWPRRHKLI